MNRGRLVTLILVLMMLLSVTACAAPAGAQTTEEVAVGVVNALDQYLPTITLPRLVVAYDADGVPSIFGIKTTTLQQLVPVNLSFLQLPPAYVAWFANTNLQHVEVELHEDGLFLYANGQPLPYLAWDSTALDQTGQLLDAMNIMQFDTVISRALPLVQRLGVDIVLQFPTAEGAEAIALRDRGARAEAVAGAGKPSTVIDVGVQYTEDGLPSVMGLTSRDLRSLGIDISFLELPAATVGVLKSMNLQRVEVVTQPDGLYLSINGKQLPHLAYSGDHLANAIDLYAQLYGESVLTTVLRTVVPALGNASIDLAVDLPGSQMAD